jgi:hypothetical protein
MDIHLFLLRLEYRIKFYYKQFLIFFAICPKCYSTMSRLSSGRMICTNGHCNDK